MLVTVIPPSEILDRRRIDLTDRDMPTHPHHHEGSWAVGRYLNTPGARAIRVCPELPSTTEERIADNRAQTNADTVMYRQSLATAAIERGWSVHWYDRDRVFHDAAAVLRSEDINTRQWRQRTYANLESRRVRTVRKTMAAIVNSTPARSDISATVANALTRPSTITVGTAENTAPPGKPVRGGRMFM